jgi:phosphocarrier protein
MQASTVTIVNKLGLHARAAAKFVTLASSFASEIKLARDGQEVNGKSIMGVMMLAAAKGTEIELEATGVDAAAALDALEILVDGRFGEDE